MKELISALDPVCTHTVIGHAGPLFEFNRDEGWSVTHNISTKQESMEFCGLSAT